MINNEISKKYEVVLGLPDFDENLSKASIVDIANEKWKEYADEFFEQTGCYVSSIAVPGKALYKKEWGCPSYGEPVITFHCTANPEFIKDIYKYEEGVLYIAKKLKKEFKQNTLTITKLFANVFYINEEN